MHARFHRRGDNETDTSDRRMVYRTLADRKSGKGGRGQQGSALGGDDAHRTCIRSRRTILTQMRNSLSRRTINNRDKGFMVARETAAIKVSDCFQSVNSRCHEVGTRQRAGAASRHPFPFERWVGHFRLSRISTAMDCICVHVCYIYSRCSLAITVLDVFRAVVTPAKNVAPIVCCYLIFKIIKSVQFLLLLRISVVIGNKYYYINLSFYIFNSFICFFLVCFYNILQNNIKLNKNARSRNAYYYM